MNDPTLILEGLWRRLAGSLQPRPEARIDAGVYRRTLVNAICETLCDAQRKA